MRLQPKRTKYRKKRKGNLKRCEFKSNSLKFGYFGLKTLESGFLKPKQVEAARRVVVRKLNRKCKLWIKVFFDYPATKKPSESRMGKGKGSVYLWVTKVAKGRVLFELCGVPQKEAKDSLTLAGKKLPLKTRFIDNSLPNNKHLAKVKKKKVFV